MFEVENNIVFMKYILSFLLFSFGMHAMDKLPDTMPEDIKIVYYKSLGHAGRGFSMEINSNTCKYIDKSIHKENEFSFALTPEELTAIYRSFVKNKVHKINFADEELIHDYDGISLTISWGNNKIDLSQSGRRISPNWSIEWKNITGQLEKIKTRELANATKEVELTLDKSLIGSFLHIQMDSNHFTFRKYIDANTLKENPIRLKLLSGTHSVFCILYKDYDEKKKKEIYSDFDPERSSLWDEKHNQYVNSLKSETFDLSLDTSSKKSFQLIRKKDKLVIQ